MLYTVIITTIVICLVSLILLKKYNNNKLKLFERILTFILIAVSLTRFFTNEALLSHCVDYIDSINKPYSNFVGIFSALLIWLNISIVILIILRSFYHFKVLNNIVKFIAPFIILLTIGFYYPIIGLLKGTYNINVFSISYAIELGISVVLLVKYWLDDYSIRMGYKDVLKFIGIFLLMNFATMPAYWLGYTFGYVRGSIIILDFSMYHRMFLYLGIAIPFFLYFTLRNKPQDIINFALTFISVGTFTVFFTRYSVDSFLEPWSWPWHLCNTAMLILPICIIFKTKRFFYFTIFINVAGALLAMLMPNYDETANLFSYFIINFWYNHWIAFFMPILCIALKLFERPKIKQFYYSLIFFFCYYALMMFLNVYFTAIGHPTDFFFINSDFIADKLGDWAVRLFNKTMVITLKSGLQLVFHTWYQLTYFVVYILISLGCWFCYTLGFDIADRHYELHLKLHAIKVDRLALESALNGRSIDQPMNENAGIKFELKDFSKKYASSKVYAVQHANLEVHGGEIFGFLGPNGAGKSTIIKSTVGIQPISEGAIEICGYDVKKQPIMAKRQIGFVPDHYALYEQLSGREYINYIADIYEVSKEDRDARMAKYISLFQMETQIDNKIKTYSHGMKQKITIMAALIHNPKVWILDEPLTGLDPTSIYQVKECMKEHAKAGNIVFFSSHIIDIVEKLCERIAIIKKGEIQCVKTVKQIEKSGKTLEQFYLDTIGEKLEDK
ncbi:MAG: YwaF family protein [Bacilli bacterium]|nr:YwaF family protein [Bacilli bacterium]